MTAAGLDRLRARLAGIDDEPVHAHPDVLDEIHRALVAELGALADSRAGGAPQGNRP